MLTSLLRFGKGTSTYMGAFCLASIVLAAVACPASAYVVLWDRPLGDGVMGSFVTTIVEGADFEWNVPVSPLGADLDGDGITELVCNWPLTRRTYIIDGATGTIEFEYVWNDGPGAVVHAMCYFNVDPQDGVSEVLIETSGRVFAISGATVSGVTPEMEGSLTGRRISIAPNPSGRRAAIAFSMPEVEAVTICIFDASGRLVRSVFSGTMPAGTHEVVWGGESETGTLVASGTYFARVEIAGRRATEKVIVLR